MRITTELPITLGFIKEALGQSATFTDFKRRINAITTDTREISKNDIFIALGGENFDGENFVNDAKLKGAYTISSKTKDSDILVKNTKSALLDLAEAYKENLNIVHTVAVTGSVGKTTTKNILSSLLSHKYKVHATYKNLNNEIGVPITIFSTPKDTEVLVIEAGMNHSGELFGISKCIKPDIAIITKIGTAHIGNFGSREKIAQAKSEIAAGMTSQNILIPYGETLLYGLLNFYTFSTENEKADYYLSVRSVLENKITFSYKCDRFYIENAEINALALHLPECLGFAISAMEKLAFDKDDIIEAINKTDFSGYDKKIKAGSNLIINDAYNSSMEAVFLAIKTLNAYKGTRSALIGDMLELGNFSEELHYEIGRALAKANISKLYLFGEYSEYIKKGALKEGFSKNSIFVNENTNEPEVTAEQIKRHSFGEVILFKASRKLRLERIIEILSKI